MAAIQTDANRLQTLVDAENGLFGSQDWLQTDQGSVLQQWYTAFVAMVQSSSDGSISAADRAQLLGMTLPDPVTPTEANEFLDRWNRSIDYWSQGIYTAAQVPAGLSTDFLDRSVLQSQFAAAQNAILESQADGFTDPYAEAQADVAQLQTDLNNTNTCATVRLQIDQTASMTRAAFNGSLQVVNGESGPLTAVQVTINITDAQGNPANNMFFFAAPTLSTLTAVDGTGTLAAGATGTANYTFIPTDAAASNGPTQYFIGGTLSYIDPETGAVVDYRRCSPRRSRSIPRRKFS